MAHTLESLEGPLSLVPRSDEALNLRTRASDPAKINNLLCQYRASLKAGGAGAEEGRAKNYYIRIVSIALDLLYVADA